MFVTVRKSGGRFRQDNKLITRFLHAEQFLIKHDTSPCIGSGIQFLRLGKGVCLPVGESLRLAYLLAEDIGIEFLKTHVLNAELCYHILKVCEFTRLELGPPLQHPKVVMPGKANLYVSAVRQETEDAPGHPDVVEPEQEAGIAAAYLQKGNLVQPAGFKRGLCLRIKSYDVLTQQVVNGFPGLRLTENGHYPTPEMNQGKLGDTLLVEFAKNCLHQNRCSARSESCATVSVCPQDSVPNTIQNYP